MLKASRLFILLLAAMLFFGPPMARAVVMPVISPASGVKTGDQLVTITCASTKAVIYYTTDGSMPTTLSTLYTGPFTVTSTQTVKAVAFEPSPAAYSVITLKVGQPAISPAAGSYPAPQNITLTSVTPGATLMYTVDGTTPSLTNGSLYTGPFALAQSATVKVGGFKEGYANSNMASAAYTLIQKTQPPVFSQAPGVYTSNIRLVITSPTVGATIRYTVDGTVPTPTAGSIYSSPGVYLTNVTTVKAIACKDGEIPSPVVWGTYTMKVGQPSFDPPSGSYDGPMYVTLSTATYGASLRYTLDGSTPTATNGTLYTGPFKVYASGTVKAGGFRNGQVASNVTSVNYTVNLLLKPILPDSGQTKCYNATGAEIDCAGTGQDGEFLINPPSFTRQDPNSSFGIVTDNTTGLMWAPDWMGESYNSTWAQAENFCNQQSQRGVGGYRDWRLPTVLELKTTVDASRPERHHQAFDGELMVEKLWAAESSQNNNFPPDVVKNRYYLWDGPYNYDRNGHIWGTLVSDNEVYNDYASARCVRGTMK